MLNVRYSTRFKKDFKTCVKRGYQMPLLQQAIDTLRIPAPLPPKNKDHNLIGNYSGYRECHIEPDWLPIYKQTEDELRLDRTGTHADLFGM
ncbi:MAG: type II toxin-antitoxin system YafQ family toxin [Lachnospiraceae bacterium]|nr:type II toxin-antitoxin system YafQ family toxin [Lachnospiraceae bacterium]